MTKRYKVGGRWMTRFTQEAAMCAAIRNLDVFYCKAQTPLALVGVAIQINGGGYL